MSVRSKWIIGLVLFAGLLWFVQATFFPSSREGKDRTGGREERANLAPDFAIKNLQGQDVRLSQYRGRVVLLLFTTTWCGYCRAETPAVKDLYARYGPQGLVILNVDIQEPRAQVAAFARRHDLPYETLLDSRGEVMQQYGVRGVPFKVLIDRAGRIVCWNCRSLDGLLERTIGTRPG